MNRFSRTELLMGAEAMARLKTAHVAVFGIGGVGSYAAEALVRSGVGAISLFDDDIICLTNINRQLIADTGTVGMAKTEVMERRILAINPSCEVTRHNVFYGRDNADGYDISAYSYVLDAIDTVTAKLILIEKAIEAETPIISCMGAGNKLDPTAFTVGDIYETSVCPLAKVMRAECRKRGIKALKTVYSKEPPIEPVSEDCHNCRLNCICPPGAARKCTDRRAIPGSVSFVPPVAGMIMAGEAVKGIAGAAAMR